MTRSISCGASTPSPTACPGRRCSRCATACVRSGALQRDRLHESAQHIGAGGVDRQHRDHVRHHVPRSEGDGPTVIECPPNSLSFVDDLWQRYVADMGNAGPDRGQGGKYLFLPPGHDVDVPDGYFVFLLADVLELGGDPRPRRAGGAVDDADLSAGRRRRPTGDRVRGLRRGLVQRHPRQRLQLLRGGRRDRPRGTRRRPRPGTGRPAGRHRDRPWPTIRTR